MLPYQKLQKKIIGVVLLLCLVDVSIANDTEATQSPNEIKLSRNRRDSCVARGALILTSNLLDVASSAVRKDPFEVASKLASFYGSIFGFRSPSTCDLDVKLEQTMGKLREIAKTVQSTEHLIECTPIKQNYREISTKLTTLLNIYEAFYRAKNEIGRENIRNTIISRCNDHTEGIHQIYSLFLIILGHDEVVDFFKHCAHYESAKVTIWGEKIRNLASLIAIVIKGCEEASNGTTQFDPPRFGEEVKELIHFHRKNTNLEQFIKDQGVLGLRSIIKTIANRGKSADETAQTLKAMFTFFDWDVIFYSSEISGTQHTTLYSPDHTYCGSHFYTRELEHGRNALVAWCIPNHKQPHDIIGSCSVRSTEICANRIRNNNKHLNYVLVINGEDTPMQLDYNRIGSRWSEMKADDRISIFYDPRKYTFVSFASRMIGKHETQKPSLTNTAVIFEHGMERVITRYNTSLSGHYKQYTEKNDYKCFQACRYEEQCAAATFHAPYTYNCFFLRKGFTKSVKPGWSAYIKNNGMNRG